MKTKLTIILILFAASCLGQIANMKIHPDTTVNGSEFSYVYRGDFRVHTVDSTDDAGPVPGFISLVNSRAEIVVRRTRIVNGDTIVKDEGVSIPLAEISSRFATVIQSQEFKDAFIQAIRNNSLTRKLKDE